MRCRFCAYAQIDGYSGDLQCEKKDVVMGEKQGKRFRQCKDFVLINCEDECKDFYMEIEYKERKSHPKAKGQMKLF